MLELHCEEVLFYSGKKEGIALHFCQPLFTTCFKSSEARNSNNEWGGRGIFPGNLSGDEPLGSLNPDPVSD